MTQQLGILEEEKSYIYWQIRSSSCILSFFYINVYYCTKAVLFNSLIFMGYTIHTLDLHFQIFNAMLH